MPKTGLTPTELQDRMLDAAEDEIRKNGVERLKLTDVARSLNLSHAALYKHFPDKEGLLDSISRRWLDRVDEALEKVTSSDLPLNKRLTEWFLTLHEMKRRKVLSDPRIYSAFNMSAEKTRPFVQKHISTMYSQLDHMIAEGMQSGSFFCKTARDGARILFEGTAAFHHPRLVFENIQEDRKGLLADLLKNLLSGLGTK